MTILHISDIHGLHNQLTTLPAADVIVHSGDFTLGGSEKETIEFMQWFCDLPYNHKVFVAGNHDMCMYGADKVEGLPDDVHYFCNSGIDIDGIKFYGMPMFMEYAMDGTYEQHIKDIPDDTDVLVTHQPPYGILDGGEYKGQASYHYGDYFLYTRVIDVKPKLHLFGHDHNAYGSIEQFGTAFSNAAVVDEHYKLKEIKYLTYKI